MKKLVLASAIAGLSLCANSAFATVLYSGSSGDLAASASFTISGDTLDITLTNTASVDPVDPAGALTGLFFDLGGSGLTADSATVSAGSIIQASQCDVSVDCATETNVGGEFSYYFDGTGHGIASSGYLAGNTSSGNFGGANLDNPAALDGINFGIVSAGFVEYSGNGGLDNDPLIQNSVTFSLSGVSGLTEADIMNVSFQYGTALSEPHFGGCTDGGDCGTTKVPEPRSLALLGLGLLGMGFVRRHAKQ